LGLASCIMADLHCLSAPILTVWNMPLSWGDLGGFATGIWCVWLTVRASVWNFPTGILNSLILALVFLDQRLFSDTSLQVVFIVLGIQGWIQWTRSQVGDEAKPITRMDSREWIGCTLGAILVWFLLWRLMLWAKGAAPPVDALITALSLVAQGLLNAKRLENWGWWIAVDLISVPLYWVRGLPLISLLYLLFLGMCIAGWRQWQRTLPERSPA
jgi:nicotinamide mononucleotide transporter